MSGIANVALLRGINVGGKNKLPMSALSEMFVEAGCKDVRTYIQSGNVIFRSPAKASAGIARKVTAAITERFGYSTPVILRTVDQLREVTLHNPYLQAGANPEALFVMFLAGQPASAGVAALDPNRSSPDLFHVRGQEIYLHILNGVANSKLTNAYFDSKLATVSTSRNWRTVNKLLELMETLG
jgi:uncharacterized protein (DUF1697 family)